GGGDVAHAVARLLLGADEEHGAAAVRDLGRELLRLLEQRLCLEQVDDVDAAALAVDEAAHLRIPASRLMAEVDSGLQQLLQADVGHRGVTPLVEVGTASGAERSRTRRSDAPGRAATSTGLAGGSWDGMCVRVY